MSFPAASCYCKKHSLSDDDIMHLYFTNQILHILIEYCLWMSSPPPPFAASVSHVTDLGSPKGIRFSEVTDTSATVHWVTPKAWVDSYQVTYLPAHGGQCLCEQKNTHSLLFILLNAISFVPKRLRKILR